MKLLIILVALYVPAQIFFTNGVEDTGMIFIIFHIVSSELREKKNITNPYVWYFMAL